MSARDSGAQISARKARFIPPPISGYKPTYSPLARHPGGRPSLYEPRYCEDLVAFMAQGYSLSAYSDYVQVNRSTLWEWAEAHKEFSQAVMRGKAARLRHWEQIGLDVAKTGGNGSQATMIIFGLKNMGSDEWKEKQEVTHNGQVTLAALVENSMKLIGESRAASEPCDAPLAPVSDDLFG